MHAVATQLPAHLSKSTGRTKTGDPHVIISSTLLVKEIIYKI